MALGLEPPSALRRTGPSTAIPSLRFVLYIGLYITSHLRPMINNSLFDPILHSQTTHHPAPPHWTHQGCPSFSGPSPPRRLHHLGATTKPMKSVGLRRTTKLVRTILSYSNDTLILTRMLCRTTPSRQRGQASDRHRFSCFPHRQPCHRYRHLCDPRLYPCPLRQCRSIPLYLGSWHAHRPRRHRCLSRVRYGYPQERW